MKITEKQNKKKIVLKVLGSVTIRPFHHLMADISKKELLHSKLKSFFSFSSYYKPTEEEYFVVLTARKRKGIKQQRWMPLLLLVVLNHL